MRAKTLGDRQAQTAAVKAELEAKLGRIPNLAGPMGRRLQADRRQTSPGTHLFADLNKALADTPPDRLAGVIMVTDGQVHDVPKSAGALGLRRAGARAADRPARRVRPPHRGAEGAALRHRRRDARYRGRGGGDRARRPTPARPITLKVRREGRPTRTLHDQIGRPVKIEMPFPHAGQNIVEVELETAPGELTPANNRVVVVAEGVRENLRVLLVSGEPHAGERTWRNLLKSDAAVDLVHFTILRPPQKQDGTPINQLSLIAFPTRELFSEKINDFDLIIFDRYQHRDILQLLYYDNIARYVETGRRAAGCRRRRLRRRHEPVPHAAVRRCCRRRRRAACSSEPFKAKLSADGTQASRDAATCRARGSEPGKEPTWGRWFRQVDVRPERGRTVMNGAENRPLLVLDRKGNGPRRAAARPTTPGCGRAATTAAVRIPICCAGCRTG